MAIHKLMVDDFIDDSFHLLAIHCSLEDYQMAYLLNQALQINLKRCNKDIDYNLTASSYSIFEWEDIQQKVIWNLVTNICKKEEETTTKTGSLFNNPQQVIRSYNLVPEYKNANYLLKIENDFNIINEKTLINKIQAIPQVITTYAIDVTTLKSSDNLIFN